MTWFWLVLALVVGLVLFAAAWWQSGRAKPEGRRGYSQQVRNMQHEQQAQQRYRDNSGPGI